MPVHAFIFPGQGSQSVGMVPDLAAAFAAAREVGAPEIWVTHGREEALIHEVEVG